jgi:hypothetical protein
MTGTSLWLYTTRFWLRDNYTDGYEVGQFFPPRARLELCADQVEARFDVSVNIGMPEDAAAFIAGCYDGAQDRGNRSKLVDSLVAEILKH